MFAAIRRYNAQQGKAGEIASRVESGFVDMLRKIPGFRSYLVLVEDQDVVSSISIFESRADLDASTEQASRWVSENVAPLVKSGPTVMTGEVKVHAQAGAPAYFDITGVKIGGQRPMIADMYEAFNERDFDRGAALLLPDAMQVTAGSGETFRGPEGYRQIMQRWLDAFPDGHIEIVNIAASDDIATVEFIGRGTNTGPLATPAGTLPATGKRVELRFCDVLRLKDGKVAGLVSYYDAGVMMQQMGLTPPMVHA